MSSTPGSSTDSRVALSGQRISAGVRLPMQKLEIMLAGFRATGSVRHVSRGRRDKLLEALADCSCRRQL